jgi:drug/metabolite transporter (DMT)-like permease
MAEPTQQAARKGLLFGLLGVLIFGLTLPATRVTVQEFDPLFVTAGRALLATALAALALLITRPPVPKRQEWLRLSIYSVCVVLGFPLFTAFAMREAPATHGGVVLAVLPLLTAMAGTVVASERPSRAFWLYGMAGTVAVLAYVWISAGGTMATHTADIYLALAAVSAAIGYAYGGELTRRLGGWEVISWALIISAPFMLVIALLAPGGMNWNASIPAWIGFVYVGVFSQFLGFFAWNKGLALGGIAKVAQVQLLQTFVTLAAGALLLGEAVGALELGCAVLVIAIVALGMRTRVAHK